MERRCRCDRFHLHDDDIFHDEIGAIRRDKPSALVDERDSALPFELQSAIVHLRLEALRIARFEEAWSHRTMDLHSGIEDTLRRRVE
jgi:hypothetical protein